MEKSVDPLDDALFDTLLGSGEWNMGGLAPEEEEALQNDMDWSEVSAFTFVPPSSSSSSSSINNSNSNNVNTSMKIKRERAKSTTSSSSIGLRAGAAAKSTRRASGGGRNSHGGGGGDEIIAIAGESFLPLPESKSTAAAVLGGCSSGGAPYFGPDAAAAAALATNAKLRENGRLLFESMQSQPLEAFREAFFGGMNSDDEDGDDDDDDDDELGGSSRGSGSKKRKRAKRPNPDADLIASATEEQMVLLGVDGNSKDGKKQRRRIRNRMSAQLHRERKKMYIDALESMVRSKDNKVMQLEAQCAALAKENHSLRNGFSGRDLSGENGFVTDAETLSLSGSSPSPMHSPSPCPSPPPPPLSSSAVPGGGGGGGGGTGIMISSNGPMRAVFPFIAVVCMICVSMFARTADFNQNQHVSSADTLSSAVQTYKLDSLSQQLTPLMLQLPLPDEMEDEDASSSSSRRRLFSTATTTSPGTQQQHQHQQQLESPATLLPPQALFFNTTSSLSNKCALWNYTKSVATLYPYPAHSIKYEVPSATSASQQKIRVMPMGAAASRRHLRSRSSSSEAQWTLGGQVSEEEEALLGKSLISSPPSSSSSSATSSSRHLMWEWPSLGIPRSTPMISDGSEKSTPVDALTPVVMSRVLLTHGRALLDPALAIAPLSDLQQGGDASGNDGATSSESTSSMSSSALSTWRIPASSSHAQSVPPVRPQIVSISGATSGTDGSDGSHVLMMLLPASAVRWGKNWEDSAAGTTESLLNVTRVHQSGQEESSVGEGDNDMWVEIGCSVFKAQIVRNVTYL